MKNPNWNENEVANYNRLTQGSEVSMVRIEGLAYTAVNEMYLARIEQKKMRQERLSIVNALDQIADGIYTLERILNVSLKEMALRHFEQRLELARKERDVQS